MLANTMYGEFVGSIPEKERRIKQQSKEKTADHRSKGKIFATQVGTRDGSHPNVTSPFFQLSSVFWSTLACEV